MQQPRVIKQFHKAGGVWSLDDLDRYVPQLIAARKANIAAADETGKAIQV